jgi:chemotaxis protein MotB
MAEKARPIIILKKKGGHGGHHGGAWKVAYADFVTAMMAFFMVLWLVGSAPKPVKEAIAGYFNDPSGSGTKTGTSMSAAAADNLSIAKDDMPKLKEQIEEAMKKMPDFKKVQDHVEMTITGEGLRIELSESSLGTFFDSGSQKLNGDGKDILVLLAQQLGKLPNNLSIEGHTDSKAYANKGGNYGNWELSSDRANAARRLMQENGIRVDQVKQVRGFADQRLRKPADPLDPSNRRISVIVQYVPKGPEDEPKPTEGEAKPGEKSEAKPGEKSETKPAEKSEGKSEAKPEGGAKPSAGSEEKK